MVCLELRKGSEMAETTMAEWRGWNSWDSWSSDLFELVDMAGPVHQQFVDTRFWHSARRLSWHRVQNMLTIQINSSPRYKLLYCIFIHDMDSFYAQFHYVSLVPDHGVVGTWDLLGGFHCEPVTIALRWGEDRIDQEMYLLRYYRNNQHMMGYHQPKQKVQ